MIILDPVSGKRVTLPSTKVGLLSTQSLRADRNNLSLERDTELLPLQLHHSHGRRGSGLRAPS